MTTPSTSTRAIRIIPGPDQEQQPADPLSKLRDRPEVGRAASLVAAVEPLLVPAAEAARLCGISEATWFRLKSAGKTPPEVRLGGRVLYRTDDLRLFVAWGCPPRKEFEARKAAENAKGRR